MSLLPIDKTQVLKILPQVRPGPTEVEYMNINILIERENHTKFDETIFQEEYLDYWTGQE